jgi:hypothetical protein
VVLFSAITQVAALLYDLMYFRLCSLLNAGVSIVSATKPILTAVNDKGKKEWLEHSQIYSSRFAAAVKLMILHNAVREEKTYLKSSSIRSIVLLSIKENHV